VNCDQVFESGAYVLGILEPDDRAAYERHLATCEICQREVADFSGLPDILAQLDPDEAASIGDALDAGAPLEREPRFASPVSAPPLRPLPSVPRANPADIPSRNVRTIDSGRSGRNSRVGRGTERRNRRWQGVTAALAAVACLALGVLVGARFIDNGPSPAPTDKRMVAMQRVAASVPISAQVALNPFIGGTEVRMHCVYDGGVPAPRWTLKLFVYPKDGSAPEQVSTWTAAHGDDLTLSAATRLTPAEIAKVELRKGDNTSLLVYQNA
jgi:anti-sigma factor RsiW